MGRSKECQMLKYDKLKAAEQVALRSGLLIECEGHGEVYDAETDCYEDTYKLANTLITQDDPSVAIFNGNRKELTDLIKDITSDYGTSCSSCYKNNR